MRQAIRFPMGALLGQDRCRRTTKWSHGQGATPLRGMEAWDEGAAVVVG